ncbi:hypothetical protein BH11MYX3_BH11MYX3_11210 [soil metagenome]
MRSFRLVLAVLLGPSLGACGFSTPASEATGDDVQPTSDAGRDAPIGPDGSTSACVAAATTCSADVLTTCSAAGAQPTAETCAWGCVSTGAAHCGHLQPSGAAVMAGDLDAAGASGAIDLAGAIDTMTGAISNLRPPGVGVVSGIGFQVRGTIGVFTFESVHVTGPLAVKEPTHSRSSRAVMSRSMRRSTRAPTDRNPGPAGARAATRA